MNPTPVNDFIVILLFGSLILLSFIKLSNPLAINKKGNFWFACFLLLYASFWIEEITELIAYNLEGTLLISLIHYFQIFTPENNESDL